MENLDRINALAETSAGYIWRLKTEGNNATALRPLGENILVNMSVWQDLDSLWHFVYGGGHLEVMRRRREWFTGMGVHLALWWLPAGTLPTVHDAERRLEALERDGPAPYAFTFKRAFSPVGVEPLAGLSAELALCD